MSEEAGADKIDCGTRRVLSKATQRDVVMRTEIRRIAEIESAVRFLASIEPVGESDIAAHFGMSMLEAGRLLDAMVRDRQIPTSARQRPTWIEQELSRSRTIPRTPTSTTHLCTLAAAGWILEPGAIWSASFDELRARHWYDEKFRAARQELRRATAAGEVELRCPGRGVIPREDCLGYRHPETGRWWDPLLDPEVVIDIKQLRNRWPERPKADLANSAAAPSTDPALAHSVPADMDASLDSLIVRSPKREMMVQMAKLVKADAQGRSPAVPVDDLEFEQIGKLSKADRNARDKRYDRLNGRGKEGVTTRLRKQYGGKQDHWEDLFDQMFPENPGKGRPSEAMKLKMEQRADYWIEKLAA
ncbi:hypothetical protein [Bradyrhizobium zhanjiangense]|uniref:Uncharacterized protein n=1 Tax=Bradyrhizobium zhanjiangense TaxID=1325107 RepID=A0A4Q0S9G1_9BRAD|nr:hypothetical protein [Bradyrhizobium zhanjiangense]RXH31995.1 hypothetical protein XH94_32540 [Bradyrhizobium zhanjiangense]